MSLDNCFYNAVQYLEKLGEARSGSIFLSFSRTEDFRRKTMIANKSPLITHIARVTIRKMPGDNVGGLMHITFQGIDEDPGKAIDKAMYEMIAWLNPPIIIKAAGPLPVTIFTENADFNFGDDGSDLV